MKKTVAIHQPNYFPWLGYFNKIYRSDTFVFLDAVQYPRTSSGNVVNRTKVLCSCQEKWLTCTLENRSSNIKIKELLIKEESKDKNFQKLVQYYKKSKYFDEVVTFLEGLILNKESYLSTYNINAIKKIAQKLNIQKEYALQSELDTSCSKEDLMIEITKKMGGEIYLSGNGARKYQKEENFLKEGVELRYQHFSIKSYQQNGCKEFKGGLSVIDALFNLGFEDTEKLIKEMI